MTKRSAVTKQRAITPKRRNSTTEAAQLEAALRDSGAYAYRDLVWKWSDEVQRLESIGADREARVLESCVDELLAQTSSHLAAVAEPWRRAWPRNRVLIGVYSPYVSIMPRD